MIRNLPPAYRSEVSRRLRQETAPGEYRDALLMLRALMDRYDPQSGRFLVQTEDLCEELWLHRARVSKLLSRLEGVGAVRRGHYGDDLTSPHRKPLFVPDVWRGESRENAECLEHGLAP